ncbi:glutathione S-transferase family protein [Novosphingobium taihuense]|uniref:Glutathione S-transferase n=1 Tax=Novosphingobium taihuense TaxID=260085 RepID=A0A7W7EVG6_9SPHN|nr:glutathione S-transferase family protein [Novosphingobium taihuense]MBB4615046.1 glutathione S-transferase [Novosphingobium taihuense]TWH79279.1 glutathione S-transferase [Novosphingobium taihuense]
MKLYAVTLSPYAARVRLALRLKGISFDLVPPPGGGTRTPEYLAISPIGKIPVLVTDDGLTIAESETIIDYLDEAFPEPSLMPSDPSVRVQIRNAVRMVELYVVPSLSRLFAQMDPASRNTHIVEAEMASLRNGLVLAQHFVDNAGFVAGGAISKADCVVLPTLLLCGVAGQIYGVSDIVSEFSELSGYRAKARKHDDMGAIWNETEEALRAIVR